MIVLIATLTASIIGVVEVSPGVCRVDHLIDGDTIHTEIRACDVKENA